MVGDSTFLSRVIIRNYKSIESCDVELGPLTLLVGPNGAGKSNFLDALCFVADSLQTTLDHAIRERGGINDVRRRSGGHPTHFGMRLDFRLEAGLSGSYYFKIGSRPRGGYEVQEEDCLVWYPGEIAGQEYFRVRNGEAHTSLNVMVPAVLPDRLHLVHMSSLAPFRPVYDAFSRIGIYNLNPDAMRRIQPANAGELLQCDGGNVASVLAQLDVHSPKTKQRIEEYLSQIVPGLEGLDITQIGPMEMVEFRQAVAGSAHPWRFLPGSMSEGTLRVLGILVALFQVSNGGRSRVPLVGIEGPEMALHPAATDVLLTSLIDASRDTQVLATSRSPDILDDERIESVLSVVADSGTTRIGPIDEANRSVMRERLLTAGNHPRLSELAQDETAERVTRWNQMPLQLPAGEHHSPDHA